MLPIPSHFDPTKVGEIWRVPYEERAREAEAGMHVVRSTDPIESWPGIAASARA
jgi:hypothetical protein